MCFLAMLGAAWVLGSERFAERWPRGKWVVAALAAANGLVGIALQLRRAVAAPVRFLPALPPQG